MKNKRILGSLIIVIIAIISSAVSYINGDMEFSVENSEMSAQTSQSSASATEYQFRKAQYLEEHFEKHGDEFGYRTAEEYLAGANRVIADSNALWKYEKEDNDRIYYIEATEEIVFVSADGYIRTYFRADRDYFDRQ